MPSCHRTFSCAALNGVACETGAANTRVYGHPQNATSVHPGSGRCGNGRNDAAIGECASFVFHGFEQARKRATGPNRDVKRPPAENIRVAGVNVRGNDTRGNGQILDSTRMEPLPYKLTDAIIHLRFRLRLPEVKEVANPDAASQLTKFADGYPIGKGGTEQTSDACPYDPDNRNVFLFKNFENAQVGESPRKSATERKHNAGHAILDEWALLTERFVRSVDRARVGIAWNCHAFTLWDRDDTSNEARGLAGRYSGTCTVS